MLRGLHKLCDKASWEDCVELAPEYSSDASQKGGWGEWTPLHLACKRDPPVEIVETLLNMAPATLGEVDIYNRIPLHYAAERGVSDENVLLLLSQTDGQEAMGAQRDVQGLTPLHLCVLGCTAEGGEEGQISRQAFPTETEIALLAEGASVADEAGSLPIHYVCALYGTFHETDVLENLIRVFPESIAVQDDEGRTPLHIFLSDMSQERQNWLVGNLQMLMSQEVAQSSDRFGYLPLHLMCQNPFHFTKESMEQVAEVFPSALTIEVENEREGEPGYVPLDIMEQTRGAVMDREQLDTFNEKSDFLFSLSPNIREYYIEEKRLGRFQQRIVRELKDQAGASSREIALSEMNQRVWKWMCKAQESHEVCASILNEIIQEAGSTTCLPPDTICGLIEDALPGMSLHYACGLLIETAPVDVFRRLIQRKPRSVVEQDSDGRTPLHIALSVISEQCEASLDKKISLLLGMDAAKIEDKEGNLPLVYACRNHKAIPVETFNRIIMSFPDAVAIKSRGEDSGLYPIDVLAKLGPTSSQDNFVSNFNDKVDLIFSFQPSLGQNVVSKDFLHRCGSRMVEEIILADKIRGYDGEKVSLREPHNNVWRWLCEERPNKPRCDACVHRIILDVFARGSVSVNACCDILLDASPEYPLHYTSELFTNIAPAALFQGLAKRVPEAVRKQDSVGRTPLHIALTKTSSKAFQSTTIKLESLVDAEGVTLKDNQGHLPLHCACMNHRGIQIDMFHKLLLHYPDGARTPLKNSTDGRIYPLDLLENSMSKHSDDCLVKFHEKSDLLFAYSRGAFSRALCLDQVQRVAMSVLDELENSNTESKPPPKTLDDMLRVPTRGLWRWMCANASTNEELQEAVLHVLSRAGELFPPGRTVVLLKACPLPLHFACRSLSETKLADVLRLFIVTDPDAVLAEDTSGKTPLNFVLSRAEELPADKLIVSLLRADVAEIADNEGFLPLHFSCLKPESISIATLRQILECFPDGSTKAVHQEQGVAYPLHLIENLREMITDANIDSFNEKSDLVFAYNPILFGNEVDEDRIGRLEERLVEDMKSSCEEGVSYFATRDVSLRRVWKWLCALSVSNATYAESVNSIVRQLLSMGQISLHFACDVLFELSSESTFLSLVKKDHKAIVKQDAKGRTPLHVAVARTPTTESHLSHDKLQMLLCPEVARIRDQDGYLPIHYAVMNNEAISFQSFERILLAFPEGAKAITNDEVNSTPLQLLERMRSCHHDEKEFNKKSDLLFIHNPEIESSRERLQRLEDLIVSEAMKNVEVTGNDDSQLLQTVVGRKAWFWLCTSPDISGSKSGSVRRIVERLVSSTLKFPPYEARSKVVRSLATMKDAETAESLCSCATVETARILLPWFRFADRFEFTHGEVHHLDSDEGTLLVRARDFSPGSVTNKIEGESTRRPAHSGKDSSVAGKDVVIKFFSSRAAFSRETQLAVALSPVICYDMDKIGTEDCSDDDMLYARDIDHAQQRQKLPFSLSEYRYAVVKGAATGSPLYEEAEQLRSNGYLRTIATSIGDLVASLHRNGIVHGNLSLRRLILRGLTDVGYDDLSNASIMNEFHGGFPIHAKTPTFSLAQPPPEMLVELSKEGEQIFEKYWETIAHDAKIASCFVDEDIRLVQSHVDAFLGQDAQGSKVCNFSNLWERITRNSRIWKKIRPRKVGGKAYALKVFIKDSKSFLPRHPNKLPYKLEKSCRSIDTWGFGCTLYELYRGSTLFAVDRVGDLSNACDFERLFSWNAKTAAGCITSSLICDPLARDLLMKLLTTADKRMSTMQEVLKHPFFASVTSTERKVASAKVLAREEKARKKQIEEENTLEKEKKVREELKRMKESQDRVREAREKWLRSKTQPLGLVSSELQVKFQYSSWNQWKTVCEKCEATFPCCLVVLPYELERGKSGDLVLPKAKYSQATQLGVLLSEMMGAVTLSSEIARGIKKDDVSLNDKINKYNQMNNVEAAYDSMGVVDICTGIVAKTRNAEKILTEVLSSCEVHNPQAHAQMIVKITLGNIIDVEKCKNVVAHSRSAEQAFATMVESLGRDSLRRTKSIVNDHFQAILGTKFCQESTRRRMEVDMALFNLLKAFVTDPLHGAMTILRKSIHSLTSLYEIEQTMYLYLVDEYTGSPVKNDVYPREIDASSGTVHAVMQCIRMSMKGLCSFSLTQGLASALGFKGMNIPQEWATIKRIPVGSFDREASTTEFDVLTDVLFGKTNGRQSASTRREQLLNLERYLVAVDPNKTYSGLKRIGDLTHTFIWCTPSSAAQMDQDVKKDLKSFTAQKGQETFTFAAEKTPRAECNHESDFDNVGEQAWRRQPSKTSKDVPDVIHLADVPEPPPKPIEGREKSVLNQNHHSISWSDNNSIPDEGRVETSFPDLPYVGDSLSFSTSSSPTDASSSIGTNNRQPFASLPNALTVTADNPRGIPRSPRNTSSPSSGGYGVLIPSSPLLASKITPKIQGGRRGRFENKLKSPTGATAQKATHANQKAVIPSATAVSKPKRSGQNSVFSYDEAQDDQENAFCPPTGQHPDLGVGATMGRQQQQPLHHPASPRAAPRTSKKKASSPKPLAASPLGEIRSAPNGISPLTTNFSVGEPPRSPLAQRKTPTNNNNSCMQHSHRGGENELPSPANSSKASSRQYHHISTMNDKDQESLSDSVGSMYFNPSPTHERREQYRRHAGWSF